MKLAVLIEARLRHRSVGNGAVFFLSVSFCRHAEQPFQGQEQGTGRDCPINSIRTGKVTEGVADHRPQSSADVNGERVGGHEGFGGQINGDIAGDGIDHRGENGCGQQIW